MSTLDYFSSILNQEMISSLKQNNIRTVLDFLHTTPENITKIIKIPFKNVLEIRQKLIDTFRKKPRTALELVKHEQNNYFILPTGISEIDELTGGLESGNIYEICGLSGCGKTQICLSIAAHTSFIEKRVLYIDTKNDFSATRVYEMLQKYGKDLTQGMERIKVTKVFTLHKLLDVLHWLKNLHKFCHIPLVIIDCISTSYFAYVGGDTPMGFPLLNHIASVMKYIVTEYNSVILLTNLATRSFHATEANQVKPCLGSYWQQVSNVRLDLRKENDFFVAVSLGKSDISINDTINHFNLSSI